MFGFSRSSHLQMNFRSSMLISKKKWYLLRVWLRLHWIYGSIWVKKKLFSHFVPLYIMCLFPQTSYKIFSLFLVLGNLIITWCNFRRVSCSPGSLSFLELWLSVLIQYIKVFGHFFPQIFFLPSSLLSPSPGLQELQLHAF